MKVAILFCLLALTGYSQSNLDKIIKSGEILVNGLAIIKAGSSVKTQGDTIPKVCVKNKLTDKVTFNIAGLDNKGNPIIKSLVIPKDGKECFLEVPKGIYTYEIVLSSKEIFKRGEYKFENEMTITVK